MIAPVVFLAYTIKGFGPAARGHKDNHAGLTHGPSNSLRYREQGRACARGMNWDRFEGLSLPEDALEAFLDKVAIPAPVASDA